ncbi:pentatricopeptide repeat-containing protein At3g62890-like [Amborella trichopoda]|uniref:pentatricopeptide repeat-containing protein At3g62890-like n=1 Tax=Amborella trichopoda TaxID=13333 RepID=UPI0009BF53AB|nr:pentatricopeptide repeat-containing protein At3g62890-like [Amborella trichopoda]|eukprot:XP_020529876.1 pentatricopeptide repeat-containing protein At3g62890-like [Amborella trichopoda]
MSKDFGIKPLIQHYGCMVDLYARAEFIGNATDLIKSMPIAPGGRILYAKRGRWDDAKNVREVMKSKGIKKTPGCSLMEVDGIVHEFFMGDKSHPKTNEIHSKLEEIMNEIKWVGYVGSTREVALDLDEEGKEHALYVHSERLAIAFCLLSTSHGLPIRVVKNLRICADCHVAVKLMSQVYNREIIVRDRSRFHHLNMVFALVMIIGDL